MKPKTGCRLAFNRIVVVTLCVLAHNAGPVGAAPMTEAAVEEVCGDQIEAGCAGDKCAFGCDKFENGKIYTYGCIFPNRTGKTKATCAKTQVGDRRQATGKTTGIGNGRPLLKAD